MTDETLSKSERLCGKKAVEALFGQGKGGVKGCLRYRYLRRKARPGSWSRFLNAVSNVQ